MTNRVGRRNRRNVPQLRLEDCGELTIPSIVCPFCNKHFSVDKFEGDVGRRACPFCEHEINHDYYDDLAYGLTKQIEALKGKKSELTGKLSLLSSKKRELSKWWQKPKQLFFRLKHFYFHKKLDPKIKQANKKLDALKQELACMARNSYYVGEWFLNTHFPIKFNGKKILHVFYNKEHDLDLWCNHELEGAGGLVGEYHVFNLFLEATLDKTSPLFSSRLIPNIYVPVKRNNANFQSFWAQIDLVLFTRSSAFIIEIKNWKSHIFVDAETREIFSSKQNGATSDTLVIDDIMYYKSKLTLDQNSNHTSWFYENFKEYPFDRIFEVTLFYKPNSFKSSFEGFSDNIYAGEISEDNVEVLEIIEKAALSQNNIFSQEKVNKMSQIILNSYGDLNQKRGRIHKTQVKRIDRANA